MCITHRLIPTVLILITAQAAQSSQFRFEWTATVADITAPGVPPDDPLPSLDGVNIGDTLVATVIYDTLEFGPGVELIGDGLDYAAPHGLRMKYEFSSGGIFMETVTGVRARDGGSLDQWNWNGGAGGLLFQANDPSDMSYDLPLPVSFNDMHGLFLGAIGQFSAPDVLWEVPTGEPSAPILHVHLSGASFEVAPFESWIDVELVDPVDENWDTYNAGAYDTYRIYASFDQAVSVIGVGDAFLDGIRFEVGVSPDYFYNTLIYTGTDPDLPPNPQNIQWDTFVTIGESMVPTGGTAMTALAPGFTTHPSRLDHGFMLDGTGWYVSGFPAHAFGDRVLIAQFTVGQGAQVTGTNWRISYNVGGEGGSTQHVFVDFVTPDPCPLDFDGNDGVRFEDLTQLLGRWGSCPDCIEDIDGDGVVGFSDLTALINAWGTCP